MYPPFTTTTSPFLILAFAKRPRPSIGLRRFSTFAENQVRPAGRSAISDLRLRHHIGPNGPRKVFLGRAMLDQIDYRVGPGFGVLDRQIVAVKAKNVPHRLECGSLVALLTGVSLRYAGHESHGEHDDVFLAIGERILRARQRAFEKAVIADKVAFLGRLHLQPIVFDGCLYRQPHRLIWQGRPGFSETSR